MNGYEENTKKIDESGLFFFKTDLLYGKKIEIVTWYKGLKPHEREYVDLLRNEAKNETEFFSQEE